MTDVEVTSAQVIVTQITPAKNEIKAPKMTASQLTPVVNSSIIWPSELSGSRCFLAIFNRPYLVFGQLFNLTQSH